MEEVQVGDGLGMKPWDPTLGPEGYRYPGWYVVVASDGVRRRLFWTGDKNGWLTDPGPDGKWFTVDNDSLYENDILAAPL